MGTLRDRLAERIRGSGPITFAEFMEDALYDPDEGFYAGTPVGRDGHFVTSPHVSPAFGDLLARQAAECWDLLGRPSAFTVVDAGAGDGTLARQLRRALRAVPDLHAALRIVGVERSPGGLRALDEAGFETARSLPDVGPFEGALLANELLDNLPFHLLREREGRTVEVRVGLGADGLVEVEAEPTTEALDALGEPLGPGEERAAAPAALAFVREVAGSLQRGYAFLFDYASGPGVTAEAHAYRGQHVLADVLGEPGTRDVTAAVDLDRIAAEARAAGLHAWGPVMQREALLATGFRLWSSGVRARQAEAEGRGDWRQANRLFAARSEAGVLIDPGKLGGLMLLALGTEGLPPPAAVRGDRDRDC